MWGMQPSSAPAAAPRRKRRVWMIWVGAAVAVLGLLSLIGGAVALGISRAASSIDPVAEAITPGTATFEAEDDTYEIFVVNGRRAADFRDAASFECAVTLADGRTMNIDGDVQDVSTEVGNTQSVGSFDAVPGATSVQCDAAGGNVKFIVDDEGTVAKIALIVILAGAGILLVGIGLLLLGIFWKRPLAAT